MTDKKLRRDLRLFTILLLVDAKGETAGSLAISYNRKFGENETSSSIAGALLQLETKGIVTRTKRYDGALWRLAEGADIAKLIE